MCWLSLHTLRVFLRYRSMSSFCARECCMCWLSLHTLRVFLHYRSMSSILCTGTLYVLISTAHVACFLCYRSMSSILCTRMLYVLIIIAHVACFFMLQIHVWHSMHGKVVCADYHCTPWAPCPCVRKLPVSTPWAPIPRAPHEHHDHSHAPVRTSHEQRKFHIEVHIEQPVDLLQLFIPLFPPYPSTPWAACWPPPTFHSSFSALS